MAVEMFSHRTALAHCQGMTVSNEGFVAIMTSKESPRALKLLITPDDPMSGGLDVEQAETSEAITLLQLMQVSAAFDRVVILPICLSLA